MIDREKLVRSLAAALREQGESGEYVRITEDDSVACLDGHFSLYEIADYILAQQEREACR